LTDIDIQVVLETTLDLVPAIVALLDQHFTDVKVHPTQPEISSTGFFHFVPRCLRLCLVVAKELK
jgi:hypothetical protein